MDTTLPSLSALPRSQSPYPQLLDPTAWDLPDPVHQPVTFSFRWEHGRLSEVTTTSAHVAHFLQLLRVRNPYNTWVNYAHDLKVFFHLVPKLPEQVTREDCIAFMRIQGEAGLRVRTINRRLAAVSSLFEELNLLDAVRFPDNPVSPRMKTSAKKLYKRTPRTVPDVVPEAELQMLYAALPTWRDRTLVLLMWISCLRISEAVAIRYQDIECSHKAITIHASKNGDPRTVYMDDTTFAAFNRYLDEERKGQYSEEGAVFVAFHGSTRGHPLSVNAVQKLLTYYAKKSQLPHLHAHLLRHTGITQLLEAGMDEPTVRKLVGHRHPASILPYTHLHDPFVDAEFQRATGRMSMAWWLTEQPASLCPPQVVTATTPP